MRISAASDSTTRDSFGRRALRRASIGLGILWAMPLTLFGIMLALSTLLGRGRLHLVHAPTPALLATGPVADYLLTKHPFGPMCAMAIGHVVIAERRSLTRQIRTHALAHVRAGAIWGIFFPLAYLTASAWAALRGKDAYWHNVFEIAARKAEKHA